MQKIKYITNKDLLGEIKICKASFCSFTQPEFSTYDAIVANTDLITEELVAKTLVAKATRLSSKTQPVESESLDPNAVVFRVMTDDHLPPIDDKKRRRSTSGSLMKTNFSPFRHYILDDGVLIEVGRSHWQGGFDSGKFNVEHGRINNRLASMFMLLVERYSRGGNWRGYTYVDEMRSHAIVQLSQVGLQFDESRSDNPFAFYTQIIKNSFRRVLNLERKSQSVRDDLLIMAGAMPSYTRQVDNEMEQRAEYPDKPAKRGRKPKEVVST